MFSDPLIFYLYFSSIFLQIGISIYTLAYNPHNKNTRLFFYFTCSTVIWLISLYLSVPSYAGATNETLTFFARLAYGGGAFFSYFLIGFFSSFVFQLEFIPIPFTSQRLSISPWIKRLISIESFALALIAIFTPLIYDHLTLASDGSFTDTFGPLFKWNEYHHYLAFLLAGLILLVKIPQTSGLAKRKLLYTFLAFVVLYGAAIMWTVILPNFGIVEYYLWGGISTGPFALALFIIMLKYRFLGVQLLFLKLLRSIITIFTILFGTYSVHTLFNPYMGNFELPIISGVAIFLYFTLVNLVFPFFLNTYAGSSFQRSIQELIEDIKDSNQIDQFASIMKQTFVHELAIPQVEVFLTSPYLSNVELPHYPQNELTQHLTLSKKALVKGEFDISEKLLQPEEYKVLVHLSFLHTEIIVPLFHRKALIGFVSFGEKRSHDPYYQEEIEALHLLSDYISAFLVNISLFREGKINQDQLERTKELQKHNIEAQHLLHDMKNSLQTALAIAKDIREKNTTTGVQRIEQSLWDLEDVLNTREDKLILTTIHITEFFHNILENYKDLFKEKHLHFSHTFTHDPSCIMRADRQKLKRILGNLLHNAYKFTPPHGTIILHTKQNAHFLSIELQNTGMGIANKNKLTIFDDGNTTHSDGKGHGLAIVRKYIEMHGGAISESGLEGKYASFHIQLPLQVESGIVIFPV